MENKLKFKVGETVQFGTGRHGTDTITYAGSLSNDNDFFNVYRVSETKKLYLEDELIKMPEEELCNDEVIYDLWNDIGGKIIGEKNNKMYSIIFPTGDRYIFRIADVQVLSLKNYNTSMYLKLRLIEGDPISCYLSKNEGYKKEDFIRLLKIYEELKGVINNG